MDRKEPLEKFYRYSLIALMALIIPRLLLKILSGEAFGWPHIFSKNAHFSNLFSEITVPIELFLIATICILYITIQKANKLWYIAPAVVLFTTIYVLLTSEPMAEKMQYFVGIPIFVIMAGSMLFCYYRAVTDLWMKR